MDTARIIKEEDEAWAAMHGLEDNEAGTVDAEFLRIVGSCAAAMTHASVVRIHQEHAVYRQPATVNWQQFTDFGTNIVRGNE